MEKEKFYNVDIKISTKRDRDSEIFLDLLDNNGFQLGYKESYHTINFELSFEEVGKLKEAIKNIFNKRKKK